MKRKRVVGDWVEGEGCCYVCHQDPDPPKLALVNCDNSRDDDCSGYVWVCEKCLESAEHVLCSDCLGLGGIVYE